LDYEEEYSRFASRISFFDFREGLPEFKKSDFDFSKIAKITEMLASRNDWDPATLSSFVRSNPMSFKVMEGLFQQLRFSNSQLAYFAFNVEELNSSDSDVRFKYAIRNLLNDPLCQDLFFEVLSNENPTSRADNLNDTLKTLGKEKVVAYFKISISNYISNVAKDFEILSHRIANPEFPDVSARFAGYVLRVLRLNEMLRVVNANEYLQHKQIPADNKSLHGKYAKTVIKEILDRHDFINLDDQLRKNNISTFEEKVDIGTTSLDGSGSFYCTEKSVKGVVTNKGKPKRFDFVVMVAGQPKHLFEVNFYSTEGTKIGINEDEYVTLNDDIKRKTPFSFHWITDGNYWLSSHGKERYIRLMKKFGEIYNMNSFEENLVRFK